MSEAGALSLADPSARVVLGVRHPDGGTSTFELRADDFERGLREIIALRCGDTPLNLLRDRVDALWLADGV